MSVTFNSLNKDVLYRILEVGYESKILDVRTIARLTVVNKIMRETCLRFALMLVPSRSPVIVTDQSGTAVEIAGTAWAGWKNEEIELVALRCFDLALNEAENSDWHNFTRLHLEQESLHFLYDFFLRAINCGFRNTYSQINSLDLISLSKPLYPQRPEYNALNAAVSGKQLWMLKNLMQDKDVAKNAGLYIEKAVNSAWNEGLITLVERQDPGVKIAAIRLSLENNNNNNNAAITILQGMGYKLRPAQARMDHHIKPILHQALRRKDFKVIYTILKECCEFKAERQFYVTVLKDCLEKPKYLNVVRLFLNKKPDIKTKDPHLKYALKVNLSGFQMYFRTVSLQPAAQADNAALIKLLVKYVDHPNMHRPIWGRTPLMIAVANGHRESVKALLRSKYCKPEYINRGRESAFSLAKNGKHDKIVALLC